jgi:uncharacterized protein YukE
MGEIKYTYQKLADSAEAIGAEKEQAQNFDKKFLTDLKADLESFRSDYADRAVNTVANMEDSKAVNMINKLEEYATALKTAGEVMKEREKKVSNDYAGGMAG